MFQIINGDLLEAKCDAICHQVNCMSVMGSGVAKAISTRWPLVKEQYLQFCRGKRPNTLLGHIHIVQLSECGGPSEVVNIFGQLSYGGLHTQTSYGALTKAFSILNKQYAGKTLAFPYRFGCGLAMGDWATVESLMLDKLVDCDVKLYRIGY